jgi:hypothetical protein
MPGVAVGRQPSGTGFALRDALPWKELASIVRGVETAGYTAVFLPEITGRDALVTLGMFVGETRRLLLGTGVLPMRSRSPLLTAMGAATVQERSGGRLSSVSDRARSDEVRSTSSGRRYCGSVPCFGATRSRRKATR